MSDTEPGATGTQMAQSSLQSLAPTSLTASQLLAFEDFVHGHSKELMRHIMYATAAEWHEAEDALWTTLGDVWRQWPSVRHPLAYVKISAIRKIAHERKKEAIRRKREREMLTQRASVHTEDQATSVWDDHEWVMSLLKSLPPRQAEVLALVYDELSTQEIGQLLGATDVTIRKRLSDARKNVRLIFKAQVCGEPSPTKETTSLGDEER